MTFQFSIIMKVLEWQPILPIKTKDPGVSEEENTIV
jgi:hypothetical protein